MPVLRQPGVDLHFDVTGHGPPVVLIQGVGVAGSAWKPQIDALAPEFTTLTFDNRGLGRSQPCSGPVRIETMATDARALMDHLGWESAHVVGHSMGGIIAQQLALDVPRRIRSLSLLCTFPRGRDAARPTPWVLWMTLRTRLGSRTSRRRAFLEMLIPRSRLDAADADGSTADLARDLGRLIGRDLADHPPVLMKQVRALARHDVSARLKELSGIPTWVQSAAADPIAPPRYGEALARSIPGARFDCLPDAAHAVPLHDPDRVNAPLQAFLKSVEHGRAAA